MCQVGVIRTNTDVETPYLKSPHRSNSLADCEINHKLTSQVRGRPPLVWLLFTLNGAANSRLTFNHISMEIIHMSERPLHNHFLPAMAAKRQNSPSRLNNSNTRAEFVQLGKSGSDVQ